MLNCLEKESFSMHASMLGIGLREDQAWRRTSVVLLFSPDAKPMPNRDFPLAIGMLFGVTAVTRCTPEKCTFDRWNVSFFGTFTWPDLSPRWWPWQHWASQGPCGGNLSRCRERAGSMLSIIRFWYLRLEDFEKLFRSPLIQISGSLWQWPFNLF